MDFLEDQAVRGRNAQQFPGTPGFHPAPRLSFRQSQQVKEALYWPYPAHPTGTHRLCCFPCACSLMQNRLPPLSDFRPCLARPPPLSCNVQGFCVHVSCLPQALLSCVLPTLPPSCVLPGPCMPAPRHVRAIGRSQGCPTS